MDIGFLFIQFVPIVFHFSSKCNRHSEGACMWDRLTFKATYSHIHTSLSLIALFLHLRGKFYTSHAWITQAMSCYDRRACGVGGQRHQAHNRHLRQTESGHRNTRAWQIELAAMRVGRTRGVGAGPMTQEWRRLTAHVKFMATPGLQGNASLT